MATLSCPAQGGSYLLQIHHKRCSSQRNLASALELFFLFLLAPVESMNNNMNEKTVTSNRIGSKWVIKDPLSPLSPLSFSFFLPSFSLLSALFERSCPETIPYFRS